MEQPENLTLAEGAQTTPNFDFLLAPPAADSACRAPRLAEKHQARTPAAGSSKRCAIRPAGASSAPGSLFARPKDTGSIHWQLPAVVVLDQCVFHDKSWH